ncbi:MAG: dolichol-phosphate mannosyltransferase [uncultured bacterium]|nr:MAG: dolichol-phosphate mannosyltransferase [uncultured bacterium]KKR25735.1 MAG: Glycosyl transferase, family 2 [Microgenomates group bacterium GW2011_GWC1_39_7b]
MRSFKYLSLVVPAYKQERTIVKDIINLDSILSSFDFKYEIIVVVDGFDDNTFDKAKSVKKNTVKVFGYEINKGKGFAVKYGVEKARGDIIGFIDAGMDIDPSEISIMLDIMEWNKADIVVGSKLHPDSKVNYPFARKILSWGYRTITHLLFGFSIRDTQVGFKLYKRIVAKDVFKRILVKRFAFDVEALAVAYRLGYKKIYESPIKLDFSGYSSVSILNFWRIILRMLWDTAAVFYRLKILHYYDK